jgi:hypothetical protein
LPLLLLLLLLLLQLRVHPSQHFSTAWLEAVSRWAHNMQAAQQQWQQSRQQPWQPPPPPPPIPAQPFRDLPDDDYDYSPNSSEAEDEQSAGDSVGNAQDDDAYDMVSYLQKMSLQDRTDNFSTATTAGSTCSGAKSVGARSAHESVSSRQQPGSASKSTPAATAAAAAAAGGSGKRGKATAAAAADVSDSESSGEWETDSEGGDDDADTAAAEGRDTNALNATAAAAEEEEALGMQLDDGGSDEGAEEGSGSDVPDQSQQDWSDADADAAVMAAEEQDLLGEASPLTPPTGTAAAAGGAANGADAASSERQGGRGARGVQQDLFVSLRLERQGLTDKQVRCLTRVMHWPLTSLCLLRLLLRVLLGSSPLVPLVTM